MAIEKNVEKIKSIVKNFQGGKIVLDEEKISPLTGIFSEDKVYIDFGEHEGKSILEISDTQPEFYQYLIEQKKVGNCIIKRTKSKEFYLHLIINI